MPPNLPNILLYAVVSLACALAIGEMVFILSTSQ